MLLVGTPPNLTPLCSDFACGWHKDNLDVNKKGKEGDSKMHNLGGDTEAYRGVGTQKPAEGGGKEKHRVGVTETHRGDTEPQGGGARKPTSVMDTQTDTRTHTQKDVHKEVVPT